MNAQEEWLITEQMMAGDFNPFHDPRNGRFTSGHKAFNHTSKLTGSIRRSYYGTISKELGVSYERAKEMGDAVNSYTQHSKEFRAYTKNPQEFEKEHGKAEAAKYARQLADLEEFIERSPKWSGRVLFRGIRVSDDKYDAFVASVKAGRPVDLKGTSSWSSNKETARAFAGVTKNVNIIHPSMGKKSVVLLTNSNHTDYGTSVAHISAKPEEREVLVTAKAHFQPSGDVKDDGKILYVYGEIVR